MNEETEVIEELELITDLLKSRDLAFETNISFYENHTVKKDFRHQTIYVPKKDDFIFLISFDIPFDGYRFSKGKKYEARYDKDIDEIKEEVKKYGRKRKI